MRKLLTFLIAPTLALFLCASSADAAARFWVGGTGTWDNAATTHWSATSGGAAGQSAPVSTDDVTFDGASGGGTITVNATLAINSLTMGAFTGTLDFSANNNSITFSAAGAGVSLTGAGTRTLNMGSGTWTISTNGNNGPGWDATTTTGLTFNKNTSTILWNGAAGDQKSFITGGLSYNIVTFAPSSVNVPIVILGSATIATMNITAPCWLKINAAVTLTITNAFAWTGTSSNIITITTNDNHGSQATISAGTGTTNTSTWTYLNNIAFTQVGGSTWASTNSFNGANNSGTGFTITAPSGGGGGGGRIIGG
jgi:hypothetical protein